jgi:hypothetical protein
MLTAYGLRFSSLGRLLMIHVEAQALLLREKVLRTLGGGRGG